MASAPTIIQPTQSRSRVPAGTQLNGIYEIEHPIASGGMGEVYKGRAIQTGDPVAIKMMLPDLAENESALALFRKEASALHNLYHEAIVRYYVFTIEPTLQCPYLAMEFVEGVSLSHMLEHGGALPFEQVRLLMQRMAAGLETAHQRGIVHRDVSPDNIIVPDSDVRKAKIIDFGIARSTKLGGEGTVIGSGFAGKYNYVSPEQLGMFGGDVRAASDIYSLGLVLVEALTGEPLNMGGSQLEVIDKRRKVPDLSSIDPRFQPLLERMLQPDPNDRPASMADVAAWVLEPEPAKKRGKTDRRPTGKAAGEQRTKQSGGARGLIAATLAVLLLAVGATAFYVFDPLRLLKTAAVVPQPPDPRPPEPRPAPPQPTLDQPRPTIEPGPGDKLERPMKSARVQQIERFVSQYNGGDCFFVSPGTVNESAAKIEGYGASIPPFEAFDQAFKRANGFEAEIGLWQVATSQCPAVNFLAQLRTSTDEPPYLRIGNSNAREGQMMRGSVGSIVHKQIELLLVTDDGKVQSLSRNLTSDCAKGCALTGSSFEFSFPAPAGRPVGQPQLLLAVASSDPLASLRLNEAVAADQIFPRVLVEAARKGQPLAAAARYFKVER